MKINFRKKTVQNKNNYDIIYQQKYANISKRLELNKDLYTKYLSDEIILTICMPTYNGDKWVMRALESILMQETTYKYKIWVIDDCSTDNTAKIVQEYQNKYPDIINLEINEHNMNAVVAPKIFNTVKTKYWMNFDQDDFWLSKDKMQRFIDYFELHDDCTLISSNVLVKASNKLTPVYKDEKSNFTFNFLEYPFPLGLLMQTSATMFRNVFTPEDLEHINSYVGTDKQYCILGDTFRNIFALSKGYGYFENSIDSVYNWTETGVWSKMNRGQQDFYNLQYFYNSIDFFKDEKYRKKMQETSKLYLDFTEKNKDMLNEAEYTEFLEIQKGLKNAK